MSEITDTDRLRWLAENAGAARRIDHGSRNAVAWWPINDEERADPLGTIRKAIDRAIARQAQDAAR